MSSQQKRARSPACRRQWAAWLLQKRRALGFTQQGLAEAVGVATYRTVLNWERGMRPSHASLRPLARALGLDLEDLLREIG